MEASKRETILLVGHESALRYLLGRFVEQSEYALSVLPEIPSAQVLTELQPKAIIFLTLEHLEAAQPLLNELSGVEAPIIVCSAVTDESRARKLDADHCLLHPITLDRFHQALHGSGAARLRAHTESGLETKNSSF